MSREATCGVCLERPSKYKCPSCLLRYCSLGCYKRHKEAPCGVAAERQASMESSQSSQAANVKQEANVAMTNESVKNEEDRATIDKDVAQEMVAKSEEISEKDVVEVKVETMDVNHAMEGSTMEIKAGDNRSYVQEEVKAESEGVIEREMNQEEVKQEQDDAGNEVMKMEWTQESLVDEEDDAPLLTKAQLDTIAKSSLVRSALENPHFRQRIKEIDAHENRLHELQKALTDPNFAQFVYGMMDQVTQPKP